VCTVLRIVTNCEVDICKKQFLMSLSRGCYSVPSFCHTQNIELLHMHRIVSVDSGEHVDKFNMCVSLQNLVVVF